jgi:aerobic carbon-monoxide dehydrogenase medium subunit
MQVPATFEYERATSIEHALELLERLGPDTRLIAGGHSLLPMMKLRLATPEHLVDINPLERELSYIREENGQVHIGALTRHRDLLASEELARHFPIVRDAERVIADPLVRNRGTLGGALCQADPSEDMSAVCTALGGTVLIRGRGGDRELSMDEFHRGPYETAVGEAEMLIEVRLPIRPHTGSAYEKVKRRAGDWATAAAGAVLRFDGPNIAEAGIALSAVNPVDVRSRRAEEALTGRPPSEETFAEAARRAAEDCEPVSDQRGPEEYKRHLAGELTHRALRRAAERGLPSQEV